jgi:hypothetical protein
MEDDLDEELRRELEGLVDADDIDFSLDAELERRRAGAGAGGDDASGACRPPAPVPARRACSR